MSLLVVVVTEPSGQLEQQLGQRCPMAKRKQESVAATATTQGSVAALAPTQGRLGLLLAPMRVVDPLLSLYDVNMSAPRSMGKGSDGYVIRAKNAEHKRWDALKYVHGDYKVEVDVMKALGSHPHIVELLGVYPSHHPRREAVLAFPKHSAPSENS